MSLVFDSGCKADFDTTTVKIAKFNSKARTSVSLQEGVFVQKITVFEILNKTCRILIW